MADHHRQYKRPLERDGNDDYERRGAKRQATGLGEVVAAHYNNIKERAIEDRYQSTIIQMRSFNNWIKSILIGNVTDMVRESLWDGDQPLTVMDFGVGKGGDLGKWSKHGIKHLIGFDIAIESLQCCRSRYGDMQRRAQRFGSVFSAEFHEADFTKTRVKSLVTDQSKVPVDIVSSQFSFHYCFESFQQVDQTLANVSENLREGGYFLLTFPDAYNLMLRWKKCKSNRFGNRIFSVDFGKKFSPLPLFGAKYRFSLEGVVDCPEFLVYFPVLVEIAEKNGLQLVFKKSFKEIFNENSTTPNGRNLLHRMSALEAYPTGSHNQRHLDERGEYRHAKRKIAEIAQGKPEGERIVVGTLSEAEWEAASLYMAAVFKKPTLADKGTRANLAIDPDD